jgi:hypothetical protein
MRRGQASLALWKVPASSASDADETISFRMLERMRRGPLMGGAGSLVGSSDGRALR